MMTSRERVALVLDHREPDRVPLDLGSNAVTGIMVTTYARLRETLGVNSRPPKVTEVLQMLAEVEVAERVRTLAPGGGFIFNSIHNIQAKVPAENVIAMYETAREVGRYPISP